tara:strand:+ start:170 stop:718 length:549 start_codon:yes stop_codon:yes gene_type:complete
MAGRLKKLPRWTDGTIAPYALDNGAWTAHQQGTEFNSAAFEEAVSIAGAGADWIVAPDIVEGGMESLEFSLSWLSRLEAYSVLLAVQDGMTVSDIRPHLSGRVGIFVGGSTDWKIDSMCEWGQLAKAVDCYLHVGRVNTCRRIRLCQRAGADSFDGTSATKFISTLPMLDNARRQTTIWERL